MAYTKTTWQTGDVITAEKLNHMEDGLAIAGGTLVIGGFTYDTENEIIGTADKTWQEIDNALTAGARCVIVVSTNGGHYLMNITGAYVDDGDYCINGNNGYNNFVAIATSADGYPATENGPSVP